MKKRILGFALMAAMTAFSGGVVANEAGEVSPLTKVNFEDFRLSFDEMYRLANPNLLSHRIFYDAPSTGPDAAWFDAIKQGNTAKVAEMIEAGQNIEAKDEDSQGQTALGWAAFIG